MNLYNGRFSVGLGSGTSLTSTILDAEKLYLAMTVIETDAQGNAVEIALAGRQAIEPAPFAAWAGNAADFNVSNDLTVGNDVTIAGDELAIGPNGANAFFVNGNDELYVSGGKGHSGGVYIGNDFNTNYNTKLGPNDGSGSTRIFGPDSDGSSTAALRLVKSSGSTMYLDDDEIDSDSELKLNVNTSNGVEVGGNLEINGRMQVDSGIIQRGGSSILTGTSDLGLYSQVSGSWIRFVTNGGRFNFFSDSGIGSTPDFTINGGNITATGNASIGGTLTVTSSITGTLNSSCPGTPIAEDYMSGSNTRTCVYEMTGTRNWTDSADRCYSNFNGAQLCTYQQIRAMAGNGGLTFDATERWLGDVTLDDQALYTNRQISGSSDSDLSNFEGDGNMDDLKRGFCCLRITN